MKGGKKRRRVSGTEEQGRDPLIRATVQDRWEAFDAAGGGAADLWQFEERENYRQSVPQSKVT